MNRGADYVKYLVPSLRARTRYLTGHREPHDQATLARTAHGAGQHRDSALSERRRIIMAEKTKSTILIAVISAISAVVVAVITTYGTIAVSEPEAKKVKMELEEMSDFKRVANLPIGTIAPSMLPPSLFAEAVGDPAVFDPEKSRWVLADKQKDITRSRYGKLLGNTRYTPDLRGMFLRGMNEGRDDNKQDPEQNRSAGHYQPDALQEHGHKTTATGFLWGANSEVGYTSDKRAKNAPIASVSAVTGADAEDETRPKNVAVYYYIKIN